MSMNFECTVQFNDNVVSQFTWKNVLIAISKNKVDATLQIGINCMDIMSKHFVHSFTFFRLLCGCGAVVSWLLN